jgi:hypothetical protein
MSGTILPQRPPQHANPLWVTAALVLAVAGYAAVFAYAMQHSTYDVWGAFLVAPVLVAVSIPVLLRFARREQDPGIGQLLVIALVLKLAASVARYYVAFHVYSGSDAARYADVGALLADDFRHLDLSLEPLGGASVVGSAFMEIVTGVVYAIIGPSFVGGFLVFSWLGFWGLFYFYRAFLVAVPDGDSRRYALLLFLLPSMLFWPSGIGKEAWMMLVLGLTAYGSALLLARRRGAAIHLAAGLAGTLAVRPHVALLVFAGLVIAYALRGRRAARVVALGRLRTLVGLAALAGVTMLVLGQVAQFVGVDQFNAETATEALDAAQRNTAQGGSEYSTSGGPSVTSMPRNVVTVLFRPFLFEAHNFQTLLTAFEGTLLLLIFLRSWPRLRAVPGRLRKQPYLTLCVTFALAFCFVFSSFQNFGILTRERVQVYPFVLVLLALPVAAAGARARGRRSTPARRTAPDYAETATRR